MILIKIKGFPNPHAENEIKTLKIIIKIFPDGTFEEFYNGKGSRIWKLFEGKTLSSNGQYQISLSKLAKLNEQVPNSEKLLKIT